MTARTTGTARTTRTPAPAYPPLPRPTAVAGVYAVPSRTHPGEVYTTDIRDAERPTCTCPAGQAEFVGCKRVPYCWHVRACLDTERARRRALIPLPLPAPMPTPAPAPRAQAGLAALQEAYAA